MRMLALCLALAASTLCPMAARAAEPIKVGVYTGALGGKAVVKALAGHKGVRAIPLKKLSTDTVIGCDALFVGAC